jgi:sigma-B regulation protein RsbU (phosphoserine phosphatase)
MDRTRQYFTLVYGVIEPTTGRFRYAMAGHPAPVLMPRGRPPAAVEGAGLPVGMIEEAAFEDRTLTLEPGDRLYLYTDGAVEARNADDEEFGPARLLQEFRRWRDRPLREGLDLAAAAVRAWCGGRLDDDVSLLAVERTG